MAVELVGEGMPGGKLFRVIHGAGRYATHIVHKSIAFFGFSGIASLRFLFFASSLLLLSSL